MAFSALDSARDRDEKKRGNVDRKIADAQKLRDALGIEADRPCAPSRPGKTATRRSSCLRRGTGELASARALLSENRRRAARQGIARSRHRDGISRASDVCATLEDGERPDAARTAREKTQGEINAIESLLNETALDEPEAVAIEQNALLARIVETIKHLESSLAATP